MAAGLHGLRWSPRHAFMLLVGLHFAVDFYGGILTPLIEPTLTSHLRSGVGAVALLIGGWALVTNIVQPLSGWLLPARGMAFLLPAAPVAAAAAAWIGLTSGWPGAAALLLVSGIGIGLLHPEAALAVHSLGARRAGVAVGLFMSAGYFGFAAGGLVGGLWAEARGLRGFWLLSLPALGLAALSVRAGLHRMEGHVQPAGATGVETDGGLAALLGMAVGVATIMCLLFRMATLLLVRRFPEAAAQGWGGATIFALGISGAIGAFCWGMVADRKGPARVLTVLNLAAIPFLILFIFTPRISLAPVWGLGLGATVGSAFPLVVVRSRKTRGFSPRLRMGLTIGGAWGMGEAAFMLAGRYVGAFPEGDARPVAHMLALCALIMTSNTLLGLRMARRSAGHT